MAFIDWTADFDLGLPAIDEQHRRLVEIINKFHEAARAGKGSRIMDEILNDLVGYTQEHFSFEEKFMAASGYEGLAAHQRQHRQLLQKIEKFQFDFNQGGRRVTAEVREFLKYWLVSHILQEDRAYADHVAAQTA